jgi:alpha-glucosidase
MVWASSNHDVSRSATRWGADDPRRARLAQTIVALLPGTYVLYYGDELGMTDSAIPGYLHRDPLTAGNLNGQWARDNARAPMRWDASEGGGFSAGVPWLPVHPETDHNVADQYDDPCSALALVRKLIAIRRIHLSDPAAGYREISVTEDGWQFDSGPLRIHVNFSDRDVVIEHTGTPMLSSRTVHPHGGDTLAPWEAVVSLRES